MLKGEMMDNTRIHAASANHAHQIDLHLWRGPPKNLDPDRPVEILVNQGFVVGFSPDRLQPLWSAYRVAGAKRDLKFDRPIHYHDDLRLPEAQQVGRHTFGKLGGVQLHVGHMTPNEVINRQFGRLAQMETFLMSNMSPQYGSLNTGVWLKLEDAIREIEDEKGHDHMWVIVGPIFGDQPASINRGPGQFLPVPEAYFCITVDPYRYPYDTLGSANIDGFIIPQDAPRSSDPQDYPATIEQIEARTNLKFFTGWGRDVPEAAMAQQMGPAPTSRMQKALGDLHPQWQSRRDSVAEAQPTGASSVEELIGQLKAEAEALQALARDLTEREAQRLDMLQHTISWLLVAADLSCAKPDEPEAEKEPVNILTYHIEEDVDGLLKQAARTACNFWNHFVEPDNSIVIRLGIFTDPGNVIATAWKPYERDGVRYGRVKFNTRFLATFTPEDIAGTVVHELGHTLGIGWDEWETLFNPQTGLFEEDAITKLPDLASMEVERGGGPGTELAHWDERLFDKELMTGIKDDGEFVMPVTIAVMKLLGHKVLQPLQKVTPLNDLLMEMANVVFTRQDEVREIDRTFFVPTDVMETIPHGAEKPANI